MVEYHNKTRSRQSTDQPYPNRILSDLVAPDSTPLVPASTLLVPACAPLVPESTRGRTTLLHVSGSRTRSVKSTLRRFDSASPAAAAAAVAVAAVAPAATTNQG
jgi:hypothetical protein